MTRLAVVFFAAFAFYAVLAAPKQATGPEKTQLEQLTDQVQTVANDVSASLQKVIPDADTIKQQIDKYKTDVADLVKKIHTEIESNKGKNEELLKDLSTKLNESIQSFTDTVKVDELKTQLENNFKNAAAEFEKLGKAVPQNLQEAGDKLADFAKNLLDDFVATGQTLQANVQKALEKN